jgi:hypothetical protein
VRRAHHHAALREARIGRAADVLGDAEVEDLHDLLRHEDVVRLDVAVNDPFLVRLGQSIARMRRDAHRVGGEHRAARDHGGERVALDELHGDEERVALLVDRVDGGDVRMVELRDRARLAQEALFPLTVGGEL